VAVVGIAQVSQCGCKRYESSRRRFMGYFFCLFGVQRLPVQYRCFGVDSRVRTLVLVSHLWGRPLLRDCNADYSTTEMQRNEAISEKEIVLYFSYGYN